MCDALETRPQSSGTVQVPQPFTEFFDDAIVIFHNWGTYLYSARTDKHGLHSLLPFIDTAVSADIDTILTLCCHRQRLLLNMTPFVSLL